MTVLDWSFAWQSIDLDAARAIADGVVRYGGGAPGPSITQSQIEDLRAHDFDLGFVWETSAGRALQGGAAGEQDARDFNDFLDHLGVPQDVTAYYACDTDPRQDAAAVIDYYSHTNIGRRPPGGYVGSDPGVDMLHTGVLTKLWIPSATSWSADYWTNEAHLRQRVGNPWELGGAYDYSDTLNPEWGQWHRPSQGDDMSATAEQQIADLHKAVLGPNWDAPDGSLQAQVGQVWATIQGAPAVGLPPLANVIINALKDLPAAAAADVVSQLTKVTLAAGSATSKAVLDKLALMFPYKAKRAGL